MFIIKLLFQHVSGIIMPIFKENKTVYYRIWCSALVVLAVVVWSRHTSNVHCVNVTVRLFLVSLSLHHMFVMHGHKSLKCTELGSLKLSPKMRFYSCC
jgi:hypothetical protein